MPGDYTRHTFDPRRDYSRVLAQQGRVMLDADLNEHADLVDHRLRALALDTLGRCTAPIDAAADPPAATGFRIVGGEGSFTIGLGRLYLHGLALDNHGGDPREPEPGLLDPRGAEPVRYEAQPHFPDPPPLADLPPGRHLVYVDAWEREVTAVEEPDLVDAAIGVDTAARMQTVWQVKVLAEPADGVRPDTPDAQVPGWEAATAPSAARLSTRLVGGQAATNPCSVPVDPGYSGWDNRLYRVQIHRGGPLNKATFKWSRDNASVAAVVTAIDATRRVLTVERLGRDDVLRIRRDAYVEVLDRDRERAGTPGQLVRVAAVGRLDEIQQTVTLADPVGADIVVDPEDPRVFIRQWDHGGAAVGADGTVPVSAATRGFGLDDGIEIIFSAQPSGGNLRAGDYWTFPARAATGSAPVFGNAAPHGPRHFYGRLALIDLASGWVTDCRAIWPPAGDHGGHGDGAVLVTPESHASHRLTIQSALDNLPAVGGKVRLAPGRYELSDPVVIGAAKGVVLAGSGPATVLRYDEPGPAVLLRDSTGVTVCDLAVEAGPEYPPEGDEPPATVGVAVLDCTDVRLLRCELTEFILLRPIRVANADTSWRALLTGMLSGHDPGWQADLAGTWANAEGTAVVLGGTVTGLLVRDCTLLFSQGLAPWHKLNPVGDDRPSDHLEIGHLQVLDSLVLAVFRGVMTIDYRTTVTVGVDVGGCAIAAYANSAVDWAASAATAGPPGAGVPPPAPTLVVRDCVLVGRPSAVNVSTSRVDVVGCRMTGRGLSAVGPGAGDGMRVTANGGRRPVQVRVRDCAIEAPRYAVAVLSEADDIDLSGNVVRGGVGGIAVHEGGRRIIVRRNDVRPGPGAPAYREFAGIELRRVTDGEVGDNRVRGPGTDPAAFGTFAGIVARHCPTLTVQRNTVTAISLGRDKRPVGIQAVGVWDRLDLVDNVVEAGDGAAPPLVDAGRLTGIEVLKTADDRPDGGCAVIVRGNRMLLHGVGTAITVTTSGPLVVAENWIRHAHPGPNPVWPFNLAVWTSSASLVASANHVIAPQPATEASAVSVQAPVATVLGNLTSGPVRLNGNLLSAPFDALNVKLPYVLPA